jgi:hypothetical protein
MRILGKFPVVTIAIIVLVVLSSAAFAEGEDAAAKAANNKSDKSGTNPINFQDDVRIYSEYSWINTEGEGNQSVTTLEFRTPFAGGKWAFRLRQDYSYLGADLDNDGEDDVNETGTGDLDFRFVTIIHQFGMNAFAGAMEVFLNTANDEVLGSGATVLGPQMFYARFFRGGWGPYKGGLFAPGLQYQRSVEEDPGRGKINKVLIDLNFLLMGKSKKHWFFMDPQIIFDLETHQEFAIIDLEWGLMLPWKGQSVYVRPAFGVGHDRPVDYGIEFGYKVVGFGS